MKQGMEIESAKTVVFSLEGVWDDGTVSRAPGAYGILPEPPCLCDRSAVVPGFVETSITQK